MHKDLRKLAKWCAKWRIKLNPEKTKVIIFSRIIPLARNSEPVLKLYGERLKIYPQVKFLGITFDSKLTFQKHFEIILRRCNTRCHSGRLIQVVPKKVLIKAFILTCSLLQFTVFEFIWIQYIYKFCLVYHLNRFRCT